MKKLLYLLFLLPAFVQAQTPLYTAPIGYNAGQPSAAPSREGTKIRFDTATNREYTWSYPLGAWVLKAQGIDPISGSVAPAYTPAKGQSTFAINAADSLYRYYSGSWHLIPTVGPTGPPGPTYTAGTGISVVGTVITNTGDLSDTNEGVLTVGAGTGSSSTISSNTSGSTPVTIQASTGITLVELGNTITIGATDFSTTNELQNLGLTGQALSITSGTGVTLPIVNVTASTGIGVSITSGNATITNTGDTDASNDLTTSSTAAGDVTGLFSNLQIASGVVGTTEITNNGVAYADIQQVAANRLLGNPTGSTANTAEIPLGTGLAFSAGNLINSAPDQTVVLTNGGGVVVTGTYPSFTLTATDQSITNEIQTLGLSGQTLSLTGSASVTLPVVGITAGTGITAVPTAGNYTITNTAPDQVVALTGAGGNVVTGTYPNFTITGTPATGAETIVTAGTNVTVTGVGTSGSPYVVNATSTATARPDKEVVIGTGSAVTSSPAFVASTTQVGINNNSETLAGILKLGNATETGKKGSFVFDVNSTTNYRNLFNLTDTTTRWEISSASRNHQLGGPSGRNRMSLDNNGHMLLGAQGTYPQIQLPMAYYGMRHTLLAANAPGLGEGQHLILGSNYPGIAGYKSDRNSQSLNFESFDDDGLTYYTESYMSVKRAVGGQSYRPWAYKFNEGVPYPSNNVGITVVNQFMGQTIFTAATKSEAELAISGAVAAMIVDTSNTGSSTQGGLMIMGADPSRNQSKLEVLTNDTTNSTIKILSTNGSARPRLGFAFDNLTNTKDYAEIGMIPQVGTTDSETGDLFFSTRNAGVKSQKATILANGQMGVGVVTPIDMLSIRDRNFSSGQTSVGVSVLAPIGGNGDGTGFAVRNSVGNTLLGQFAVGVNSFLYTADINVRSGGGPMWTILRAKNSGSVSMPHTPARAGETQLAYFNMTDTSLAWGPFALGVIPASGASTGDVIKWNGSIWAPAADLGVVSLPATQVGFGTGTGITSATAMTYTSAGLTVGNPGEIAKGRLDVYGTSTSDTIPTIVVGSQGAQLSSRIGFVYQNGTTKQPYFMLKGTAVSAGASNYTGYGEIYTANAGAQIMAVRINQAGQVGIGTTTTPRLLTVNGEVRIADLTTDTPTGIVGHDGDGDLGAITFTTGISLVSGALTVADASASNELQTLSVASNVVTLSNSGGSFTLAGAGGITPTTSGSTITLTGTPASLPSTQIGYGTGSALTSSSSYTITSTGAAFGNPGVTAKSRLDVYSASTSDTIPTITVGSQGGQVSGRIGFVYQNGTVRQPYFLIKGTAIDGSAANFTGYGEFITANAGTQITAMRINPGGQVGIGTTSTARLLVVGGEVRIVDLTTDTPTRFVGADADGDLGQITLGTGFSLPSGVLTYTETSSGTVTSVAATAPAAGFTVSGSPITTTGTLTFALANDLAAVEGLSGTGIAVRTGTDTWTNRTITAGTGISVADGNGVSGNPTITNTGDTNASDDHTGTGTADYVTRWTGTLSQGIGVLRDNNSMVSIGIAPGSALGKLHIVGGNAAATPPLYFAGYKNEAGIYPGAIFDFGATNGLAAGVFMMKANGFNAAGIGLQSASAYNGNLIFGTGKHSAGGYREVARIDSIGNMGLATNVPTNTLDVNGTVRVRSVSGITPTTLIGRDANGAIGTVGFGSGFSIVSGNITYTGGSSALSALTAATATNSINNVDWTQTWSWNSADTETGMVWTGNALTSGGLLQLSTTNNSLNSTDGLLTVKNNGTSTNGKLATFLANSTAGSGVTFLTNGNVGFSTASPLAALHINRATGYTDSLIIAQVNSSNKFYVTASGKGYFAGDLRVAGAGTGTPAGLWTYDAIGKLVKVTVGTNLSFSGNTLNAAGGGGGGTALSAITAAVADNTIRNAANVQIWKWPTLTTQTAMNLLDSLTTTGGLMQISSTSAAINSTDGLLTVKNNTSVTNGMVFTAVSNTGAAGRGLYVRANARVGINNTAPISALTTKGVGYFGNTWPVLPSIESTLVGGIDSVNFRVSTTIENRSNTSGGHASLYSKVGGTSGGDPAVVLDVAGGTTWSMGVDNSDDDRLKFGPSSTVGTSPVLEMLSTGVAAVVLERTITAGGTTGNQTINKLAGTVNFAAAATTLVVTNSLVTTSSIIFAVVRTGDTTAVIKNVIPASGSFTITLSAAATAETSVGFFVTN